MKSYASHCGCSSAIAKHAKNNTNILMYICNEVQGREKIFKKYLPCTVDPFEVVLQFHDLIIHAECIHSSQ